MSDSQLEAILDDLSSRFLLNVPENELSSFERIGFLIEQAHWFYEDFYRERDETLQEFTLKQFAKLMFNHCPILRPHAHLMDEIFASFLHYKGRVPVCGAVLINQEWDKLLLVKGFSNKACWSFPRGKINQDESQLKCAIREVYEEIGFDISDRIKESQYIEARSKEQKVRLYLVTNIPESTEFITRTRKEISFIYQRIEWHSLKDIPADKTKSNDKTYQRYYNVLPYMSKIKKWIKRNSPYQHYYISSGIESEANEMTRKIELKRKLKAKNEPEAKPETKPESEREVKAQRKILARSTSTEIVFKFNAKEIMQAFNLYLK